MALDDINRALASHDLVQDVKWNPELRAEFETDEAAVLDRYPLTKAERSAIERRDFRALYDLGFHPYLGAQLARILYHARTAEEGGRAARALNDSLNGRTRPADAVAS